MTASSVLFPFLSHTALRTFSTALFATTVTNFLAASIARLPVSDMQTDAFDLRIVRMSGLLSRSLTLAQFKTDFILCSASREDSIAEERTLVQIAVSSISRCIARAYFEIVSNGRLSRRRGGRVFNPTSLRSLRPLAVASGH